MKANWIVFLNSLRPPMELQELASVFDSHMRVISSDAHHLKSNVVLSELAGDLEGMGYLVERMGYLDERRKRDEDLIHIPVLFGEHGTVEKDFRADGYHPEHRIVLEVEAGRAVANNQFLKDLIEACMMEGSRYLCIAVRQIYSSGGATSQDCDRVCTFFRTLYASNRM